MKFFKYGFPLIFAVMFSIPLIVIIDTMPQQKYWENLAKTGTKATAYVYDYYKSYDDDEGDDEYKYKYQFDIDGEEYRGTSRKSYSYNKAKSFVGKEIEVSYTFENGELKVIESDYDYDETVMLVLGSIFEVVAIVAFIVFIKFVVDAIKRNRVRKYGVVAVGHITDYTSNTRINGVPYYNIKYYWTADNGEVVNTTSPADYTYHEAKYYSNVKEFEIKTSGKLSVITEKPFAKQVTVQQANLAPDVESNTPAEEMITCEYCNITFKRSSGKCPCCGAPIVYKRNTNKY